MGDDLQQPRPSPFAESALARRLATYLPPAVAAAVGLLFFAYELSYTDGRLGFPLDDSWIHLVFARNLAAGEGLAYNTPGEIIAATTAPLWTAIVSLLYLVPGSPLLTVKIAGVACYVAGVDATRRLALELGLDWRLAGFAALLTALTGWLAWSAMSGMEVPLFILVSLWGIVLHLRERRSGGIVSLGLLALSVLARPEGLLLLTLAFCDRLLVASRDEDGALRLERPALAPLFGAAVLAVVLLVPVALFNLLHGGSFLPTTFAAKSTGVARWLPDLHALYRTLAVFMSEKPLLTFTSIAGCLALWERLGERLDRGLLPAAWLLGLPLAYTTIGGVKGGNFGRYFFPLFPLVVVLGVLGVERALKASGGVVRVGRHRVPLAAFLALLVLWPAGSSIHRGLGRFLQSVQNVDDSNVAMARWIGARISPEAVLAVNDVGAIKYLLPNRILDLAGIIDPEVPRYMDEARKEGRNYQEGVLRFLTETRPDYMVIFPFWFPDLAADETLFTPLHRIEIPQNITMGGDDLVLLATPWTRYPAAEPAGGGEAE